MSIFYVVGGFRSVCELTPLTSVFFNPELVAVCGFVEVYLSF